MSSESIDQTAADTAGAVAPATGERLPHASLGRLHALMRRDLSASEWDVTDEERIALGRRVLLGQPVRIGGDADGPAVLRIALGGGLIVRCSVVAQGGRTFAERLQTMESEIRATRAKLLTLLRHRAQWDTEQ